MAKKFILSLNLSEESSRFLTLLRAKYFPVERNFLAAHITLFHALAEETRAVWEADLNVLKQTPFAIRLTEPYSLGRGVAIRVESPELLCLRNKLASAWIEFMTPQDRQGFRPHCTLQNKVDVAVARATLGEIKALWQTLETQAQGLTLSEYQGGPWREEKLFPFT